MSLSKEDWNYVLERMPIPCIDVAMRYNTPEHDNEILWIRRNNEPYYDKWALVGGRIYKHESINMALERIVKSETGVKLQYEPRHLVGADSVDFGWRHDISLLYDVPITTDYKLDFDPTQVKDFMFTKGRPAPIGEMHKRSYEKLKPRLFE